MDVVLPEDAIKRQVVAAGVATPAQNIENPTVFIHTGMDDNYTHNDLHNW